MIDISKIDHALLDQPAISNVLFHPRPECGQSESATDKIRNFHKPTLIIHAEHDHTIPHSEGVLLFETCPAVEKTLLTILHANHNDIFMRGLKDYMAALSKFAGGLTTDTTA